MNTELQQVEQHLQQVLGMRVIGMSSVIRALTVSVVARGHVLLQGPPGLGKTLLSKSLASAIGGKFKRIQGTSDLMPSDIIGVHVFDAAKSEFIFHPGPVFADVVLMDEINRSGPKTQSALLEAMEERQISVDRKNFSLPEDFLVIATQNPRDFEGTYPLPESQLDRFMLRIDLQYPLHDHEKLVLEQYGMTSMPHSSPASSVLSRDLLNAARSLADTIHVSSELSDYILSVARATREHPHISLGLSTRGALALLRSARIAAGLNGSKFVTPDDVKAVAPLVVPHRLMLSPDALLEGVTDQLVVQRILDQVAVPR